MKKFNIGLFGGETIGNVVLCNAVTGECTDYKIEDAGAKLLFETQLTLYPDKRINDSGQC